MEAIVPLYAGVCHNKTRILCHQFISRKISIFADRIGNQYDLQGQHVYPEWPRQWR
jgi:hypothetical protein